jgi:hypothetical protein
MSKSTTFDSASILVATPSTDDKKINVYQFPEEKLKFVVPKVATTDTGEWAILLCMLLCSASAILMNNPVPLR